MNPIYENERYHVFNQGSKNSTEKNYIVINRELGNIEYSTDMLIDALRMAEVLSIGLNQFYANKLQEETLEFVYNPKLN